MHQNLYRMSSQQRNGQMQCRQLRGNHRRHRRVVVSDDREFSGHMNSMIVRPLNQSGGNRVIPGQNGGCIGCEHLFGQTDARLNRIVPS